MILFERSSATWSPTNPGGYFTGSSMPSRIPTVTSPDQVAAGTGLVAAGDGVLPIGKDGAYCARNVQLIPYGLGTAGQTFLISVLGWRPTTGGFGQFVNPVLWVPVLLASYTATLGTATGVATSDIPATGVFASGITRTAGPVGAASAPDWFEISPGGALISLICLRTLGFRFLETIYSTGSSAAGCNALWARM